MIRFLLSVFASMLFVSVAQAEDAPKAKLIRVGIIGLDTSHVTAFAKAMNDPKAAADVAGCRVVAAYPKGSPDIESSTKRVPTFTKAMKEINVEIVDSIEDLLTKVDAVLLETNDGRPHLEQVLPVFRAGKPVFIDKPIAGTLADAIAIAEAAKKLKGSFFSTSSLRYGTKTQAARNGALGEIKSCETTGPSPLEKTHPDLFWYGIHGVESLFTAMGTGCVSVKRSETEDKKIRVVGKWNGGRTGTYTEAKDYSGKAVGSKGEGPVGESVGYRPLVVEIVKFFKTGKPAVDAAETLEIFAFMEAADESKRQGGAEVTLESVLKKARVDATARLKSLGVE